MNLADIFSAIDSKKRALVDALRNPGLAVDKATGQMRDNSREMSQEFDQSGYLPRAGQRPHPNQEQAREALGQRGTDMALAGMFVGPRSQVWNAEKAMKASKMLDEGHVGSDTWWDTGTMRGAEGAFKQEIPDNEAILRKGLSGLAKPLGEVIDHPELLKAYPDLMASIKTQLVPGASSFYDPVNKLIGVGKDSNKLSSLLHEVQHTIQEKENWARGGNIGQFAKPLVAGEKLDVPTFLRAVKSYKKIAGEEEARLTQARHKMGAARRSENYPGYGFDTPMEDQILQGVDTSMLPVSQTKQIIEQMRRVKP